MSRPAIWSARTPEHLVFFRREVLAPLVAATRAPELRTAEAVMDASRAWVLSLSDLPAELLTAGVVHLLQTLGAGAWMPKPGDLRAACAAVVTERRRAAARAGQSAIEACEACGGSTWRERLAADGSVLGMVRCGCHVRALSLVTEAEPTRVALPSPVEIEA